jgi:hypothetical protein
VAGGALSAGMLLAIGNRNYSSWSLPQFEQYA